MAEPIDNATTHVRLTLNANQVIAEIVADLECRTHDSVRWRDGVTRVAVQAT